mgnify:FL=1
MQIDKVAAVAVEVSEALGRIAIKNPSEDNLDYKTFVDECFNDIISIEDGSSDIGRAVKAIAAKVNVKTTF